MLERRYFAVFGFFFVERARWIGLDCVGAAVYGNDALLRAIWLHHIGRRHSEHGCDWLVPRADQCVQRDGFDGIDTIADADADAHSYTYTYAHTHAYADTIAIDQGYERSAAHTRSWRTGGGGDGACVACRGRSITKSHSA